MASKLRWNRGRKPDPSRPGTIYRAGPVHFHNDDVAVHQPNPPAYQSNPSAYEPANPPAYEPNPPAYQPAPPGAAAPRRRRHPWRWVALVAVLLVIYPLGLFTVAWTSLHKVAALPASGPADSPGRTYLVVGSDSRSSMSRAERARLGTGSAAGQRTDTIMLLHVPAGSGPVALVSIPRDSYVPIPGHGKNKINAAYAFGGPALLATTVENVTGLHIDDYVETGFEGFAGMVDAVGGVTICPKRAMNDPKAHLKISAGCQQVDGATALGYARARYSDPLGDLGRVQRQREVLAAIAKKTMSPSVLLLPWRAFSAAGSGGDALTVDEGTTPVALARFVLAMKAEAAGKGVSLTVPIATANLRTPAGDAVAWNTAAAKHLFALIRADDTAAIKTS